MKTKKTYGLAVYSGLGNLIDAIEHLTLAGVRRICKSYPHCRFAIFEEKKRREL